MMREEYDIKTLDPRKNPYTELLHQDGLVSFTDENRSACKENAAIYATKELQKDPANDRDKVGQDPKEAADRM